nr:hypothetical protein [Candidatus Omnitrophota bacterium]
MNRGLILLAVLAVCVPTNVFATATGEGTVEFIFSEGYGINPPAPTQYRANENYYGSLSAYNYQTDTRSYPWDPQGAVYLDNNYIDETTYELSKIKGQWDPNTGAASVFATATSTNPGVLDAYISFDIGNAFSIGSFTTLPDFSYIYNLAASKDSLYDYAG